MDVWVVAAAAGAGYVVQHLKNLSRGKNKRLGSTPENPNNVRPHSFGNRHNEERDEGCEAAFAFEASIGGYEYEDVVMRDSIMSYRNIFDSSSLAPVLNEDPRDWEGRLPSHNKEGFTSDLSDLPSSSEIGFSNNSRGKRSSLKCRRFSSQFIKPQTSLESCLMAQLHEERDGIEEYARHPFGKPILRPFIVTDGSKIISTLLHESFNLPIGAGTENCQLQKYGEASKVHETVSGVPRLPNLVPMELRNKAKTRDKRKHFSGRTDSSKGGCGDHGDAQGTSDRALIFYLGLTMGVVSSFMANKQEVENMKCLLKQSESLVQDLQEELEMKDTLTVKELAGEDYDELQDLHTGYYIDDRVHSLSLEEGFHEECCSEKAEDKSLNEIEAELEAELQRLESSIISSSLEGKLGNLTGLDPESTPVFHEGKSWSDSFAVDRDETCSSCHYAVSPRELSLRLHQVIQLRLEERVKELEMALQNNQRKIEFIESEHVHPWRELSKSVTRTSSTHGSPIAGNKHESINQPVIINLSGEALSAYNEAFEEFTKVSESDSEDLQAENGYHVQNGWTDRHSFFNWNREKLKDLCSSTDNIVCSSSEEIDDGDQEEMERLLIRQIVEKAKQGSPAVLKAQRAFLLSNNENEH